MLPGWANKTTKFLVKYEFQIKNEFFLVKACSMQYLEHYTKNIIGYLKFLFNWASCLVFFFFFGNSNT